LIGRISENLRPSGPAFVAENVLSEYLFLELAKGFASRQTRLGLVLGKALDNLFFQIVDSTVARYFIFAGRIKG
jgi:hypothetical protein